MQQSPGETVSSANEELAASWREGGAQVTVLHVRSRQLWTVPDKWESVDAKPEVQQIVGGIAGWIDSTVQVAP